MSAPHPPTDHPSGPQRYCDLGGSCSGPGVLRRVLTWRPTSASIRAVWKATGSRPPRLRQPAYPRSPPRVGDHESSREPDRQGPCPPRRLLVTCPEVTTSAKRAASPASWPTDAAWISTPGSTRYPRPACELGTLPSGLDGDHAAVVGPNLPLQQLPNRGRQH